MRLIVAILATVLIPWAAQAARPARIDLDVVEVRDGPGEKYKILFPLSRGDGLAAANIPIEGYYKIRTLDGRIGWVPADSWLFADVPRGAPQPKELEAQGGSVGPAAAKRKWFGLRLLGGYGYLDPGEINNTIGAAAIQSGINVGLELGVLFSERFSAWVRAERVFQQVTAVETGGSYYVWDLSSWPVMAGMEFKIWSNRHFTTNIGVLGGVGFATDFSSTAPASAVPRTTTYFGTAYGFLARAGVAWTPLHWLQVGIEAGYRFLRTPSMSPVVIGNGGEVLQTNGQYPSIAIDMGGPFGGLTIGFQL